MRPRHPIYVPSKGRWQEGRSLTARFLTADRVPFRLVVEPQEEDAYRRRFGDELVLTLPENDRGLLFARNWIRDHAEAAGAARHWQFDDNIGQIRRLYAGKRIPADAGPAIAAVEDFVDRYKNVALAGMNYQMFVTPTSPPYRTNVHVYSCVAPETLILCADLVWRAAGDLQIGQEIVAFDEEPVAGDGRAARHYRTATIDRNDSATKPCVRVSTDCGDPIVASEEHPWLVLRAPPLERAREDRAAGEDSRRRARLRWVRTSDLRVGDQIAHLASPWKLDESHDGGWIGGMFDGEGSMTVRARAASSRTYGVSIGIAQKPGPVLDRLRSALLDRGYDAWMGNGNGERSDGTYLRGGFAEMLRFAGEFRPTRIVGRLEEMWEGRKLWAGTTYELATVSLIEPMGEHPVASISTSEGTFVTGGYLTHNCTLVNHDCPSRWRLLYNDDTDLCIQVLSAGWTTVLTNLFMVDKKTTMTVAGGNNDDARGPINYQGDGRLRMARALEKVWPDVVTVDWRWGRPQHVVNWAAFRTPLELRDGVDLEALRRAGPNEYGSTLKELAPPRSAELRALLDGYRARFAAGGGSRPVQAEADPKPPAPTGYEVGSV